MALPIIQPYALPTAAEIKAPKVSWKAERSRVALLIHDMQNYFLRPFAAGKSPIVPAIANINALRTHCRGNGIPVYFTAQRGNQDPRDRGLQRDFWGPGMRAEDNAPGIVDALAPTPEEFVLEKHRYSAFQRSNLETLMRARGRDQIIVTGVYAHIGCMLTAADAFMRDIEPFFVADAVADFSREKHDFAVTYAGERCAVAITTAELLRSL